MQQEAYSTKTPGDEQIDRPTVNLPITIMKKRSTHILLRFKYPRKMGNKIRTITTWSTSVAYQRLIGLKTTTNQIFNCFQLVGWLDKRRFLNGH